MQQINDSAKKYNLSATFIVFSEARNIEQQSKRIHLKTANNRFLCADGAKGDTIIADRENGWEWETFRLLSIKNNGYAILSYKKKFFTTFNNILTASGTELTPVSIFKLNKIGKEKITLQANNGRYLSLNKQNAKLNTITTTVSENEILQIIFEP